MKRLILIIALFSILNIYSINPAAVNTVICEKQAVTMNLDEKEISRVNALVKAGYHGNYTLKWALEHDYTEADKVKWVNIKKYSSQTQYLVWVSIEYQRLNIFTGSTGNWNLVKSCIIGSGAPGRDTPAGVWKLISHNAQGWSTSDYTVKPVITFINERYGFHSRLYCPNSTNLYDGRIGYPCSHGCIRMYTDDVTWFYETVSLGTTVVVH